MQRLISILALIVLTTSGARTAEIAQWIGVQPDHAAKPATVVFHKTFNLDFSAQEAYLKFTCYTPSDFGGTRYRAYVNNLQTVGGSFWQDVQYVGLSKVLRNGDNEIDIEVTWVPTGTPGPVLAKLIVRGKDKDGKDATVVIRSDETWSYSFGKFEINEKARPTREPHEVVVVGAADSWEPAKNPEVLPKTDTSTVVGVTDAKIKGGNAGTLYQFNLVRDYSDKYYLLDALGYSSIEDYIFGQTNYQTPGEWFWGYDKQIAHNHEINGYDFTVYPWVWVPAEWYRKQEDPPMVRCIEHGKDGFGLSLFSPQLLKLNAEVYAQLKSNFGESIKFVYPGIYGDFGEAHYMAGWNPWMNPKPEHQHAGFWAGDDLARADFRDRMLSRYATLDALNAAWKTQFTSKDEIAYPKLNGSDPRRYALDFINWYYDSMTDFTAKVCAIAKKSFPDVPIAPKLGCGDENPMWGQDNSAIPEALAKIGVGVRSTHGSSPNFAVRRISSACKFYGNRFETETAGGTNREEATKKFFIDASCGCAEVFEYPNAIAKVSDLFSQCRRNLRSEHSITSVALFFPTSWHRANLRQGYPPKLVEAAEELRDITDFDVVDENMVLDGALDKYQALAMFDGDFTEQAVYDKIDAWVSAGGTLLLRSEQLPFTNVEGSPLPVSQYADEAKEGGSIHEQGKGQIVVWGDAWDERGDYYSLIYDAAYPKAEGEAVDGEKNGVWTSLFKNRVLYLNTTDKPVRITERVSPAFAHRAGLEFKPEYLSYSIEIPEKSQASRFLDRPSAEVTLECEQMEGAKKMQIASINHGGYGALGQAVKMQGKTSLAGSLTVNADAIYGFCCIADPTSGTSSLEIDGKKVVDLAGPKGPHKFAYPINIKLHLKKGKHSIAIKCEDGELSADKLIVTSDTDLMGFTYGFIDPKADQSW